MKAAAELKAAAMLQTLGLDGMRFLTSEDPVEIVTMQVVAQQAQRLVEQRDKSLAILIGNAVARSTRG